MLLRPESFRGRLIGRPACDLFGDTHVLCFGEKSQGLFTTLPTNPAGFHAAEGDAQVAHQPAIHPDCSGVDLFRDAMGAIQILRPDAGGEPVIGVVGVLDHFFFVVERRDGNDRAKDFFAIDTT